ncbi:hypothetical protein EDC96DRAFT_506566 [Choanephora cucurbitarum]|nr:hypothetical protein EDC96DRAFT_506566 [Choanephora cucurbitarum]
MYYYSANFVLLTALCLSIRNKGHGDDYKMISLFFGITLQFILLEFFAQFTLFHILSFSKVILNLLRLIRAIEPSTLQK